MPAARACENPTGEGSVGRKGEASYAPKRGDDAQRAQDSSAVEVVAHQSRGMPGTGVATDVSRSEASAAQDGDERGQGGKDAAVNGSASSSSHAGKRAATKYNLFLKEALQDIKVRRPDLDHKQCFSEAARLWRVYRQAQLLAPQSTVAAEGGAADGPTGQGSSSVATLDGSAAPPSSAAHSSRSVPYKCRKCGQPKRGHTCPFEASIEDEESDDDVLQQQGAAKGAGETNSLITIGDDVDDTESDSDSSRDMSDEDADSEVEVGEEEECADEGAAPSQGAPCVCARALHRKVLHAC